ncbi:hypothetical protein PUNSTDRAFT_137928 [Punctularia strigosozonata HHB-11173 SS5]|uniref:Uncharacterized protein n=1 Tax=Punctularia strigosozonata (strain HHB-11173) TaxID=741275 RepID=R7S5X9_PUNST|nr:uncharacterized protein PUNSTDRAFT_137928 [Punctularia strigosozonata HHB-11173 SS5]EIN05246.1 hypothetical protein PUNSTDRAFT_137928 [Punctularia strigosozonata HHB-11173 SS5]
MVEAELWEQPTGPDTEHGTIHAFGMRGEHYHWPANGAQGPFYVVTAGSAVGIFTNRSLVTTITSFTVSYHSVHYDFKEAYDVWHAALAGSTVTVIY